MTQFTKYSLSSFGYKNLGDLAYWTDPITGYKTRRIVSGGYYSIDTELDPTGFGGVRGVNYKNVLISTNIGWEEYWKESSKVLFFAETSNIADGKLYNEVIGSTDYLTVSGSAGSETYQCPDTADYITADTENILFDSITGRKTITTGTLIGYDLQRIPTKYDDNYPNTLRVIIILKSGEVLDELERIRLFRNLRLNKYWDNTFCDSGQVKSNRNGQTKWNQFGSELMPTFATDNALWIKDSGVAIADGVCHFLNVGQGDQIYRVVNTVIGLTYRLALKIKNYVIGSAYNNDTIGAITSNGVYVNESVIENGIYNLSGTAALNTFDIEYISIKKKNSETGLKLVTLGDSITYQQHWHTELAKDKKLVYSSTEIITGTGGHAPMAIGGATVIPYVDEALSRPAGRSMYIRADDVKFYNPDIIILFVGGNDIYLTLGETDEEVYTGLETGIPYPSFCSSYKGTLTKLCDQNYGVKIICVSPLYATHIPYADKQPYVAAQKTITEYLADYYPSNNIQFIDLLNDSGIDGTNYQAYLADIAHPNEAGGIIIGDMIGAKI